MVKTPESGGGNAELVTRIGPYSVEIEPFHPASGNRHYLEAQLAYKVEQIAFAERKRQSMPERAVERMFKDQEIDALNTQIILGLRELADAIEENLAELNKFNRSD